MTDRPDFDRMTQDEMFAWSKNVWEAAVARNRPPLREYNHAKWDNPPISRATSVQVVLRPGEPIVCDTPVGRFRGVMEGLRKVADRGAYALLVGLPDVDAVPARWWAIRRADGLPWAAKVDAVRGSAPQRWVPVMAWRVPGDVATLPSPGEVAAWNTYTPFRFAPQDADWFDGLEERRLPPRSRGWW